MYTTDDDEGFHGNFDPCMETTLPPRWTMPQIIWCHHKSLTILAKREREILSHVYFTLLPSQERGYESQKTCTIFPE
jgi:hypothetical protein